MLPTNGHSCAPRRGFTLVELIVAMSISAIVLGGILSVYLFLGRNLTRLVNLQQQESHSRRVLEYFTRDLSAATQLTTATTTQLILTKPAASGTITVTYAFDAAEGEFVRQESGATAQKLVSDLTSLSLNYFNEAGVTTSSPQSIKAVELAFSSAVGNAGGGTRASFTSVSPRVILRNKVALQ